MAVCDRQSLESAKRGAMSNTAFCLNNILCSTGKKKFQPDPSCCPVCGVTLRSGELDSHFVQELERLYKLGVGGGGPAGGGGGATRPRRLSSPHHVSSTDGSLEARWEVCSHDIVCANLFSYGIASKPI